MDRSIEMIIALYGVLKAGGAYVPLDPNYPRDRIQHIVGESGISILLSHRSHQSKIEGLGKIRMNLEQAGEVLSRYVQIDPTWDFPLDSLAYIIYTSGSTGNPKGVGIAHRSLVNYSWWARNQYFRGERLSFGFFTSLCFDLTVTSIFTPLISGNSIIIIPPSRGLELKEILSDPRIGIVKMTPSHLSVLRDYDFSLSRVKRMIIGGEALDSYLCRDIYRHHGDHIEIFNEYGPTETTVGSTVYLFNPDDPQHDVLIGRPIANTTVYILDSSLRVVPVGVKGELYIGGDGVARGYVNRPELTAERFIRDPFSEDPDRRLYKTGDICRWLEDGNIEYLGRADDQVKIRGFRVELGEIESMLRSHPSVRQAVVMVREDEPGRKVLVGYVVMNEPGKLDKEGLRNHLASKLPDYMMPSAFVEIETIPLSASGKADRKGLPKPTAIGGEARSGTLPQTQTEIRLAEIWKDVLKIETVYREDHFFRLGGHSLTAVQAIYRVQETFSIQVSVSVVFEHPTLKEFALVTERMLGDERNRSLRIPRVSRDVPIPQSYAQKRLWLIRQSIECPELYNTAFVVYLHGALDPEILERSLRILVDRHEVFRTTYCMSHDNPLQRIQSQMDWHLQIESYEPDDPSLSIQEWFVLRAKQEARFPYDFEKGPLFRFHLLRGTEQEWALLLNLHHILTDDWSMGVFLEELQSVYRDLYEGHGVKLKDKSIDYADYSCWQHASIDELIARDSEYWEKRLAGVEPLALPCDFSRPLKPSYVGCWKSLSVSPSVYERIQSYCREHDITLYMYLLTALNILLSRYCRTTDICVGSLHANRDSRILQDIVGFFVNTLVIRTDLSGNPSFARAIDQVKAACLEAHLHQGMPFDILVEKIHPEREPGRSQLFQILFGHEDTRYRNLDLPGMRCEVQDIDTGTSKFDISWFAEENKDGLSIRIEYNTDLFKVGTIDRMLGHFTRLLESGLDNPDAPVFEMPMMSQEELHTVLTEWNSTAVPYPTRELVHHYFERQADRSPDAPAVILEEESLTYRQLNERANCLAHYLQECGVGPDDPVGVCMGRSLNFLVAMMGIFKAGGAYTPLDPSHPVDRMRHILDESRMKVVLTQSGPVPLPDDRDLHRIDLETGWERICQRADPSNLSCQVGLNHAAYILYTSGSTGKPKGVVVEHGAFLNSLQWLQDTFSLTSEDRVLQKTVSTFDVSLWELVWPLMYGAAVVLARPGRQGDMDYLTEVIQSRRITVINFVPSVLEIFVEHPHAARCRSLRLVLSAGEALSCRLQETFHHILAAELHNLYGPTETIQVSWWPCQQKVVLKTVPIGRPIANTQLYILDERMRPVPIGVAGELYIGGVQVARGYLSRPDLTAKRFIPDPFNGKTGARLYQSGDICRYLEDGNIEYLGRADHQVKIRGFRVELGEIESVLRDHPSVLQAVVIAREDEPGQKYLAGYVVLDGKGGIDAEGLRRYLGQKLPEYMIPSAILELTEIPLTASGKADRIRLPKPFRREPERQDVAAPQTEIEMRIAAIWKELLGVHSVFREDDFFRLGGHSLKAVQAIYRIQATYRIHIPVSALFEHPILKDFAGAVENLLADEKNRSQPIRRVPRDAPLPQSYAQKRMWFVQQMTGDSPVYNVPFLLYLDGHLNIEALERSLRTIVERHEAFRTTFTVRDDGQAVQVIGSILPWNMPVDEILVSAEQTADEAFQTAAERLAKRCFDMERGPLFEFRLMKAGPDRFALFLNMHHLITDGWSLGVMLEELTELYHADSEGRTAKLSDLPIQYVDYGCWQRDQIQSILDHSLEYWRTALSGDLPETTLPYDRPRSALQTFSGRGISYSIHPRLYSRLQELGREHQATLNMTLMAAFNALLHRILGTEDIILGSPISGRTHRDVEKLIGLFVNTVVLRTNMGGDPSFVEALRRVQRSCKDAQEHQDLPYDVIVEKLHPHREGNRNPFFQILFDYENSQSRIVPWPGLDVRIQSVVTPTAKFDLTLFAEETDRGLILRAEYNSDLYQEETIRRFLRLYEHLLESVVADPNQRIDQIDLMTREDTLAISSWNTTERPYPRDRCIHQLFEDQVAQTPDAISVEFEDQTLTYSQLNTKANPLAHYLREHGVGPDVPVGVYMDRSPEMMVALLAILKAGGSYVPLDPLYPAERLRFMAEDAGLKLIFADSILPEILPESIQRIDPADVRVFRSYPTDNPGWEGTADNLAYIVFTSGSTGKPKGVAVPHRGVVRLVFGQDYMEFRPGLTMLQLAPVSFDASTLEIWGPLLHGGRCVLYPGRVPELKRLEKVLQSRKIDALWLTASLFNLVIDTRPQMLSTVGTVLTGGEALSVPHVRKALEALPNTQLVNGYGPTESTTFTCCHRIPKALLERLSSIPIGRPIGNTQVFILDSHRQMVSIGVAGEMYIGGDGLARGYVNRPELTAERFIPNPFREDSESRLYKTGDICRWLEDGTIEFLGRTDDQVKIRGFRIEMGEIESVFRSHPSVLQAVVIVREDELGQKVLVGYGVSKETGKLEEETVRKFLATKLPEYMVPSAILEVTEIPLTASGKVDRQRLPRPQSQETSLRVSLPQTETEITLAAIWKRLLKREVVNREDHFFRLGGHSLLAAELFFRIQEQFSIHLPIPTIFQAPTLGQLATMIDTATTEMTTRDLVQIKSGSGSAPIFYLPGIGGHTLSFYHLAEAMQIDSPQYGLNLRGLDGKSPPQERIEEMAAYFIELIRAVQPKGPYNLCGFSFGGRVAFEIALQLQAAGERVGFVGLLGTTAPGYPPMPENPLLRIGYRLYDLCRIGPVRQWRYLQFKFGRGLSRLRRRIRKHPTNEAAAVLMALSHQQAIADAAMKAWYRYMPARRLVGNIAIFRESKSLSDLYARYDDPLYGWGRYVEGKVQSFRIDCGHLDLFQKPYVETLARQLEQYLQETRGGK